jgi:uncharacterized protein involved in outer membrane biogenesis
MVNHRKIKGGLYIFGAAFAVYLLAGFFLAPWAGEKFLIKRWGNFMGRHVAIESVSINPLTLTVLAEGISVKENNGVNFLSVRSLFVDFSIASLFKLAPVSTCYEMDSPVINLVLKEDNTFNFSDLLEMSDQDSTAPSPEEPKNFGLKVSNAKILNGQIHFSDQIRKQAHHIENLNLSLPFLSTLEADKDTTVLADLECSLNQAGIKIRLESRPFTPGRDTTVTLETGTIDLLTYVEYMPLPETLFLNQMETSLDLAATYSQAGNPEKPSLILKGNVTLANMDIQDADHTPVLTVPQIDLTFAPADLLDKQLGIAGLKILSPKIFLARDAGGRLNIFKYLPEGQKPAEAGNTPEPEKSEDKPEIAGFVVQVDTAQIVDASLSFTDAANKSAFATVLSPVSIQANNVTAKQGVTGQYSISLKTEADERIASDGRFSTTPLDIEGRVTLEQLVLKKYLPYVEYFINFDIQEGQLDLDAGFALSEDAGKFFAVINNRELRLANLKVWDPVNQEIPVSIPEIRITESFADTKNQRFDLGKIQTDQGEIFLKRQADGSINLVNNLLPDLSDAQGRQKSADKASPEGSAWQISLSEFSLDNYKIDLVDETQKDPVQIKLSDIRVQAENFKTWGDETSGVAVGMAWNETGKIEIKGDLVLSALTADLAVSLDKIDIQSFQPYFTDQVNLLVTQGVVQTQGSVLLDLKVNASPRVAFKGKTSVTDFVSLGKFSGQEFFKCSSLYLSGMDISLLPVKAAVQDISLTDFYSRVIISEKGNINLKQIMAGSEKEKTNSPASPAASSNTESAGLRPEIIISNVTLQGGEIYYEDNFTQPNVSADMKKIAGQVKGLSSIEGDAPADLQLRGLHGRSSPLDIAGRISPLTEKQFLDLNISFKDIELTRFSPYSAKYIGYEIEKGKLVLDLNYQIDGNALKAKNRFFLDQFTLGQKVDSEDATSLPVSLAISLLKNSEGQIDLDVPLSGDLDDPEFSFSVAFLEVLGNLIMKVITSPFKFLGALVGGGEDLGFVNFEYGSDVIPDNQIQKMDQLIEILAKKTDLDLEIEGTFNRIEDGEVLRQKKYDALIKSEKINALAAKGTPVSSIESLTLLPQERESAVIKAYELADFPKPREEDGKEKQITLAEKEKLLITHLDINERHLEELAISRAENIKHYIQSSGKVAPTRIFLLNPEQAEQGPDQGRFGRVIFLIK